MPYIVIDTEGTGLFTTVNPDGTTRASDAPGQPRMAEFAAVLLDDNFDVKDEFQAYIDPTGWDIDVMPEEAFRIHGLSIPFLREHGVSVELPLKFYDNAVRAGFEVIGHNQQHDGRQVRAELRRAGMDDMFEQTKVICTMRSASKNKKIIGQVKKLNGKGGWARLGDLANHFGIDHDPEKHHSALNDCRTAAAIAKVLAERGALLPGETYYAKNHPSRTEGEA